MPISTTQSIWRSGGGDTTRQAYCGTGLMTAGFFDANVTASSNAVVAFGQTDQVILPANAVVTSVVITSPITSGTINVGFTTITGGISNASFYVANSTATSARVIAPGSTGAGGGIGTVANASVNTVLTIESGQGSPGNGTVGGFVTYFVTDYLFGQQNV
jgi:CxxC motif-containing protein (DUF1111 family)